MYQSPIGAMSQGKFISKLQITVRIWYTCASKILLSSAWMARSLTFQWWSHTVSDWYLKYGEGNHFNSHPCNMYPVSAIFVVLMLYSHSTHTSKTGSQPLQLKHEARVQLLVAAIDINCNFLTKCINLNLLLSWTN